MNAAEQARSVQLVSKIASVVSLFKSEFPRSNVDLKPWQNDPQTQQLVDPDSIDIGVHFPGRNGECESRCLLVQIRFHRNPVGQQQRALGLEVSGYDHRGQQWRFSTVEQWEFYGEQVPSPAARAKLKHVFRQVLALFDLEMAS